MRPADSTAFDRRGVPVAGIRDPLSNPGALRAARARTMSERLELALSWNAAAAELRAGMAGATSPSHRT
jgi:hypothetical protein